MYVRRGKGRWATTWRKGHYVEKGPREKGHCAIKTSTSEEMPLCKREKKTTAKESGAGDMIMKGSKHAIE